MTDRTFPYSIPGGDPSTGIVLLIWAWGSGWWKEERDRVNGVTLAGLKLRVAKPPPRRPFLGGGDGRFRGMGGIKLEYRSVEVI